MMMMMMMIARHIKASILFLSAEFANAHQARAAYFSMESDVDMHSRGGGIKWL